MPHILGILEALHSEKLRVVFLGGLDVTHSESSEHERVPDLVTKNNLEVGHHLKRLKTANGLNQ